jgi:hypothetical protein
LFFCPAGPNPDGVADGVLEASAVVEEVDLHSQKENGDIARSEGRESDGVLFGGEEGEAAAGAGTSQGIFHFAHGEAVVVGKGALVNDLGT